MGANGPYMLYFLGNDVSIFVEIFKNNQKNNIFCLETIIFVQKKIIFFDQIFFKVHLLIDENHFKAISDRFRLFKCDIVSSQDNFPKKPTR